MRVNINIDEDFLKDIDKSAEKWHLSRSAYISACCSFCMMLPIGFSADKDTRKSVQALLKTGAIVPEEENEET